MLDRERRRSYLLKLLYLKLSDMNRVVVCFFILPVLVSLQNALLSHQSHVQPVMNSLGTLPNAALTAGRSDATVATPAATVSPFDPLETKVSI